MEHRLHKRVFCRTPVSVRHPVHGWSRGHLRNMSVGGALVTLDKPTFSDNSPVLLAFRIDDAELEFQLPAMVVRSDGESIGLMFLSDEHDVDDLLGRILKAADCVRRGIATVGATESVSRVA